MNWRLEILKKKSFKTINGIWNCWFAADFMAAMLVDKNKEAFPHTGNYFFHASSAKKEKNLIFLSTNKANLESKRKANQQGYSSKNLKKCHYYYRPKHLNSNTHKLILDKFWKSKSTRNCFLFNFIFTVFLIFFLELFRQFSGNSTIHYSTTQRAIPGVKRHVHLNMQINEFHRFHWPVSSWDSSASLMAKYLARWSTTKKKKYKDKSVYK